MKTFSSRSYSSQLFRPRPEVLSDVENNILIIATPWGPRSCAEKVIQTIQDYYFSARGDVDTTSPFEFLTCLSSAANDIRVSVMLANDKVYVSENRNEYNSGCELLVMAKNESELNWVQIGHPGLLLSRPGLGLIPFGVNLDLSLDVSTKDNLICPLPNSLLGIYQSSNFSVQTMTPQAGDKIIALSRTFLPTNLFSLTYENINLDSVTDVLVKNNPENPFWLGIIEF